MAKRYTPTPAREHTFDDFSRILTPTDTTERRRLSLQNDLFKLCHSGRLTSTRLPPGWPLRILDVGTGSGVWAISMGAAFPQASIIGVDISGSMLPGRTESIPSNVKFVVGDFESDAWGAEYEDGFDFIHMRNLIGGRVQNWEKLLRKVETLLKPGGRVEYSDIVLRCRDFNGETTTDDTPVVNGTAKRNPASEELADALSRAGRELQIDYEPAERVRRLLEGLDLGIVVGAVEYVPVRAWGGDFLTRRKGDLMHEVFLLSAENYALRPLMKCGWQEEDVFGLIRRVEEELLQQPRQLYASLVFVTARKPAKT